MTDNFVGKGYSKDLFVSPTEGLVCGICDKVLNDPQQCKNGHLFCLACVQSQLSKGDNKCVECGVGVSLVEIGSCLFAKNMINTLKVRCKCSVNNTSSDTCEWIGTILDLETRKCEFLPELCANPGCGEKFVGSQRAIHASECHHRVVNCEHCQKSMTFQKMEGHLRRCDKRPVHCECGEVVVHNAMEEHVALVCPMTEVECPIAAIQCCSDTCPGGVMRKDLSTHITEVTGTPDCMLKIILTIGQLREAQQEISCASAAGPGKKRPRADSTVIKRELQPLKLRIIPSAKANESSSSTDGSMQDEFSTSSQRVCSPIRDLPATCRASNAHEAELSLLNDLFSNSDNEAPDDASIDTAMEVEASPEPGTSSSTAAPSTRLEATESVTSQSGLKGSSYTYKGDLNSEGKRHGHGVMHWLSGSHAGDVYKGQFSNGLRRGVGVMSYNNGDTYTGDWLKDWRHGKGVMQYANKETFEGEWRHSMRHGEGTYTYTNGDSYSGTWTKDCMHGQGKYTWVKSGDVYEGTWVQNEKNGEGEYRYANGDLYAGHFKDDRLDGKGVMRYVGGNSFEGTWRNGYQHGKGTMKIRGGGGRGRRSSVEEQEWVWGKKVEG